MIGRLKSLFRAAAARKRQRRRRVGPWWRHAHGLAAVGLAAAIAVVVVSTWLWHGGLARRATAEAHDRLIAGSARLGFEIREVFVIGRKRTPREQLIAALGADRGRPILALDLEAARQRMLTLPWVRSVAIERLLPDTVVVRLIEREPIALWQRGGQFALLGDEGEVIASALSADFADLLVVVGEDAPRHTAELLALLDAEPDLRPLITAAVRVGGRRWNLHLAGGLEVRLPAEDAAEAWHRLAEYQRSHRLLEKDLQTVDLRLLPERLIVRRLPPGERRRPGGDA